MASGKKRDLRIYPGFRSMTWFCLALLYAPMVVITVYSFNAIRSITTWGGFSLDWYVKAFNNPSIQQATINSLVIALAAATFATVLATSAAIAMIRGRAFRGQSGVFALINLPARVIRHARRLILRLPDGHPGLELVLEARQTLQGLARGPTG